MSEHRAHSIQKRNTTARPTSAQSYRARENRVRLRAHTAKREVLRARVGRISRNNRFIVSVLLLLLVACGGCIPIHIHIPTKPCVCWSVCVCLCVGCVRTRQCTAQEHRIFFFFLLSRHSHYRPNKQCVILIYRESVASRRSVWTVSCMCARHTHVLCNCGLMGLPIECVLSYVSERLITAQYTGRPSFLLRMAIESPHANPSCQPPPPVYMHAIVTTPVVRSSSAVKCWLFGQ